jgi:large subunit ribosomal protein L13
MSVDPLLIDASNHIMGRVASVAAKQALHGRKVVVVNAEKAIIAGQKHKTIRAAMHELTTGTHGSQERAPTHPRRADTYFRRAIRGMLPRKKPKGKAAFSNVKVFIGVPEEYSGKQLERLPEADASKLRCRYITVGELCKAIGGDRQ